MRVRIFGLTANKNSCIILNEIGFHFLLHSFLNFMQSSLATKLLPIVTGDKKLEVSLNDNQAVIKLSTWTEDLGWCCQKTLSLDSEMLDDLHRVIASARYKLKSNGAATPESGEASNILKFPSFT